MVDLEGVSLRVLLLGTSARSRGLTLWRALACETSSQAPGSYAGSSAGRGLLGIEKEKERKSKKKGKKIHQISFLNS